MLKYEAEERELLDGLIDAIGALPDGHAEIDEREVPIGPHGRVDALIDARIGAQELQLLVEAKREGFPRDVRETVWQLRNHLAHMPSADREILPFFIARAISPGARNILREERVGFYDLGGSLYIPARHAFVYVDRPVPKKNARIFVSLFQGQKARVVQAVFDRRSDWLSVKELAESTEVSPATVSATLGELERREWIDVEGAGPSKLRRLRSAKALVDAWSSYVADQKPPKLTRYYVPGSNALELAQQLDLACRDADAAYAVTAEAAAQLYAPYLSSISQVKCRIEPGRRQEEALERLNARPVSEGWNLGLLETRARGDVTVAESIENVRLASPLQVYLDLLQGSGRSREMAAHLRSERLEA